MSETLPGNVAYDIGHYAAERVPSKWSPETDAAVAGAYATLALVQEQRTANLIAWADFMIRHTGSADAIDFDEFTIAARLGLTGATE